MKLVWLNVALLSFSSIASAQEYMMSLPNLSRLKPPRADMPPAVFAGHEAFVDLAESAKVIALTDGADGRPQVIVNLSTGGSVVFNRLATHQNIFQADISATPIAAYPEGRLLLALEKPKPNVAFDDNPLIAATLYIVGKYPFGSWGYGDVETPKFFSEAKWVRTGLQYLGTVSSSDRCDPRFPCIPEISHQYRGEFENPLTGEKVVEIQQVKRRL